MGEAAYLKVEERRVGRDQEAGYSLCHLPRAVGGGAVLAGWPQQETWGGLGGIHESLSLTNAMLWADNTNASVHQAVLRSASSDAQTLGSGFHPPQHLNHGKAGGRAWPAPDQGDDKQMSEDKGAGCAGSCQSGLLLALNSHRAQTSSEERARRNQRAMLSFYSEAKLF